MILKFQSLLTTMSTFPVSGSSLSSRARLTSSTSTRRRSGRGSRRRPPPSTSPSSTTRRGASIGSFPWRGRRCVIKAIFYQNPWKSVHPSCMNSKAGLASSIFHAISGCYQLHHHAEHDFHEDFAKVRAVVRRQGEHGLRARICIGDRAEQGGERGLNAKIIAMKLILAKYNFFLI